MQQSIIKNIPIILLFGIFTWCVVIVIARHSETESYKRIASDYHKSLVLVCKGDETKVCEFKVKL